MLIKPNIFIPWENLEVREQFFDKFDISNININLLLFQTGYLTVKRYHEDIYVLSYPNKEIEQALLYNLMEEYSGKSYGDTEKLLGIGFSERKRNIYSFKSIEVDREGVVEVKQQSGILWNANGIAVTGQVNQFEFSQGIPSRKSIEVLFFLNFLYKIFAIYFYVSYIPMTAQTSSQTPSKIFSSPFSSFYFDFILTTFK